MPVVPTHGAEGELDPAAPRPGALPSPCGLLHAHVTRHQGGQNGGRETFIWSGRGSAEASPEAPRPLIWFSLPARLQNVVSPVTAPGGFFLNK